MPRLAGSPALLGVEARLIEQLAGWGFEVSVRPFPVTAASLDAVSIFGAGIGVIGFGAFPLLVLPVAGWTAVLLVVSAVAAVVVIAAGIGSGRLPSSREAVEARNLEARRGRPAIWLVAHSDSKGQGISLLGRVVAVVALAAGMLGLLVLLLVRRDGPVNWVPAALVAAPMVVGGGLLSRSGPRNTSPGAVDNATGLTAVLVAAEALRDCSDVGVVITGAEEYAMAGARVWSAAAGTTAPFVNVDGVDARGRYHLALHRPAGPRHAEGVERHLAGAIRAELERRGERVRVAPLPPGVLVDGRVLARGGQPGVTLSKGDAATLHVVHTHRDHPGRASIDAAVEAGRAVAAGVQHMLVDGPAGTP